MECNEHWTDDTSDSAGGGQGNACVELSVCKRPGRLRTLENGGQTPLSFAARAGYESMVKMLRGREETLIGEVMVAKHRSRLPRRKDPRAW